MMHTVIDLHEKWRYDITQDRIGTTGSIGLGLMHISGIPNRDRRVI